MPKILIADKDMIKLSLFSLIMDSKPSIYKSKEKVAKNCVKRKSAGTACLLTLPTKPKIKITSKSIMKQIIFKMITFLRPNASIKYPVKN